MFFTKLLKVLKTIVELLPLVEMLVEELKKQKPKKDELPKSE